MAQTNIVRADAAAGSGFDASERHASFDHCLIVTGIPDMMLPERVGGELNQSDAPAITRSILPESEVCILTPQEVPPAVRGTARLAADVRACPFARPAPMSASVRPAGAFTRFEYFVLPANSGQVIQEWVPADQLGPVPIVEHQMPGNPNYFAGF